MQPNNSEPIIPDKVAYGIAVVGVLIASVWVYSVYKSGVRSQDESNRRNAELMRQYDSYSNAKPYVPRTKTDTQQPKIPTLEENGQAMRAKEAERVRRTELFKRDPGCAQHPNGYWQPLPTSAGGGIGIKTETGEDGRQYVWHPCTAGDY